MKKFVVYKSSAGSGKTYTLVREYITLALTYPAYFRQILAITFTNKAANEMKQRVLTSLLHLADPVKYKDSAAVKFMLTDISKTSEIPVHQISSKAKEVLSSVLHDYDDFAVRTIDSFVSRIIRTFAHDLHLPVDFEIEMDKDVMLDEAVNRLIAKAGIEADLTRILVEFTESKAAEEKSWHIENDIHFAGNHLFSEEGNKYASSLKNVTSPQVLKIIGQVKSFMAAYREAVMAPAEKAWKLFREQNIPVDAFYYGKQGIGAFFMALSKGEIKRPNSRVKDTISKNQWFGSKTEIIYQTAITALIPELSACFNEIDQHLETGFSDFIMLELAGKYLYQLGVISAVEQELTNLKREKKVLHISEFNKLITDIIIKEPVPFIYERTGERYRHYLVDEFQDTSELQWKNLLPLITNSLASAQFNLVVGDGKQAIYRFRNGQVEQFLLLPDLPANYDADVFSEAKDALRNNYQERLLNSNFRSLPIIIEFNNDFFTWVSGRLDESFRGIYSRHEQFAIPGKKGGFVSIDFLAGDDKIEFADLTFGRVQEIINDLSAKGYAYSDMVILTRSNAQGSQTARFLIEQGLNVVSNEALLLASSPEVNLLISALSNLSDPDDSIARAAILVYLSVRKKCHPGLAGLGAAAAAESFDSFLSAAGYGFNRSRLLSMPIYDLCEELIRLFGLNGSSYDPFIQFFLEFVNRVTLHETYDLKDLLAQWDEKKGKLSVIVPEGIDAIKIMTIHKAKGLEFPVVIWPFANDTLKNTLDTVWVEPSHPVLKTLPTVLLPLSAELGNAGYDELYAIERNKSLLDMINLIYVAFTRPAERLYIISKQQDGNSVSLPSLLSEYLASSGLKWSRGGDSYFLGDDEMLSSVTHDEEKDTPFVNSFLSRDWHGKINIAKRAPEIWEGEETGTQQLWGQWVHDALSLAGKSNQENAVKEISRRESLNLAQSERLCKQLDAVLNHPLLHSFFTSDYIRFSEIGILLPDGSIIRPDLVAISEKGAILLEFKTGQPMEEHIRQVYTYADALISMGYHIVQKYLVYINDEQVIVKVVD